MKLNETTYKLAFSFLKRKMSAEMLREMKDRDISPEDFFSLPTKDLFTRLGINPVNEWDKMGRDEAVSIAKSEYSKIHNHPITPLFILDEDYPQQLAETSDPPVILYKLGDADLEAEKMISIVGTRKPTPYGIDFCNKIVDEISCYFPDAEIISGLAYGIDACSHRKALEKGLTTIAVVAHGLNMIYPAAHRNLAKEILKSGGAIISEYPFDTQPYKTHFLARNRIVAGLCDATIVVESNIKGGAMSTANYAFLYNREVLALPGRISDELSSGCNLLIRKNKARLIEGGADLIEATGWNPLDIPVSTQQRNLFPELDGDAKRIYEVLQNSKEPLQLDQIAYKTEISVPLLMSKLNELEFDGIVLRYPGNRFTIA